MRSIDVQALSIQERRPQVGISKANIAGSNMKAGTAASRRTWSVRHRVIIFVVALIACFAVGVAAAGAGEPSVTQDSSQVVHYTVQPGDSLWSIANRFPDGSSSDYQRVEKLKQVNNLRGGALQAGQSIVIPM